MIQRIDRVNSINGKLVLPGDKSISHRAVMFSAMAEGKSKVYNYLDSDDVNSTINCFRKLGIVIDKSENELTIHGKGINGLRESDTPLDAGNSGTTTRLISGILSAQKFTSTIVGDESLSKRPMLRVVNPLRQMGANIELTDNGTLPMTIHPADKISAIEYNMEIASAQIKSALLLAGLYNEDETIVVEHARTRNHTERMLGLKVEEFGDYRKVYSSKEKYPIAKEYVVPSDISTASFFIVLALLAKNSELLLKDVLLNETRAGIVEILQKMGGKIEVENQRESSGEKIGDLRIFSSELKNIEIGQKLIPNIIDEIPILTVAGLFAEGSFSINNAKELRFKESDRIKAICKNYKLLGVDCREYDDGFEITGTVKNKDVLIESYGDHRIAMTFAVLGMIMGNDIAVNNFESVAVSNPDFLEQVQKLSE